MDPALLDRALLFAARAHEGQTRKGTDTPYILHPVAVAMILTRHGFGPVHVVAGLLHDVVEDCDVPAERVAEEFGAEVAALVVALSKPPGPKRPWREARQFMLDGVAHHGRDAAIVKCADALHNAHATLHDVRAHGAAVWDRFNAPAEDIRWYYGAVADACRPFLADHPLLAELDEVVRALRAE